MKTEKFEIRNGGLLIRGRHFCPKHRRGAPVIISHEFGLNMLSTARYARLLCNAGYSVYIYDFCGSGSGISKGRSSTEMSVLTEKEDLLLVMDHVRNREDCNRLILGGCSLGGFVSALAAAEAADTVDKLFLIYPALCVPDDARHGIMLGSKIDPVNLPEKFTVLGYVRLGTKYVTDALTLEPWREICAYKKPVLLIHGTADSMVDISFSRRAAQEYQNARLIEIEGGKHLFLRPKTVRRAVKYVLDYLADE